MLRRLSGFDSEGQPPRILDLDYAQHRLYLYATSKVERRSRAFSCRKEPWTIAWLERHLRAGDVVYDIGANIGAYALVAAHRVGPTGRVFAFEPGYASFAHLCDNIVLNGLESTIIPVPLPVGERSALSNLSYHRLYPGHARHVSGDDDAAETDSPAYRQPVLQMALDDLARQFELATPRLMKIDVDGTELAVLRGARTLLRRSSLEHLLIEIEAGNTDAVIDELAAAGLALVDRHQRTYDDGTPAGYWYGLFARNP
jgi:FkbM family methyltransferase